MKNRCRLKNIRKLKSGYVSYTVIDPGGNEIKCKRKDTVENIKQRFEDYRERIQADNNSIDKTIAEGRHRFAAS